MFTNRKDELSGGFGLSTLPEHEEHSIRGADRFFKNTSLFGSDMEPISFDIGTKRHHTYAGVLCLYDKKKRGVCLSKFFTKRDYQRYSTSI